MTRIYESPRVTKPYSDEQWERIETLGHAVDADLAESDVRLTMGGEPTFVSIDDPDGAEWNFTAVSHEKRVLSGELLRRLRGKFAPGALLHYGQGKWYPGEPLPRWALACYWRKDGVPIWKDDSLIADESKDYGYGAKEAKELALRIAAKLGVDSQWLLPAYEDVFYYTWKERRLPSNVTPEKSNLKNKQERERLARLFQQGLGEVAGYALPFKRAWFGGEPFWLSGLVVSARRRDFMAHSRRFADGPAPADGFASVGGGKRISAGFIRPIRSRNLPPLPKQFPSATRAGQHFVAVAGAALPARSGPGPARAKSWKTTTPATRPAPRQSAPWIVRTALCVEPREGRLHVFLPPVETTEDYLDMVAGSRSRGQRNGHARPDRRRDAAERPAAEQIGGDAGSRRDRSEPAPQRDLG